MISRAYEPIWMPVRKNENKRIIHPGALFVEVATMCYFPVFIPSNRYPNELYITSIYRPLRKQLGRVYSSSSQNCKNNTFEQGQDKRLQGHLFNSDAPSKKQCTKWQAGST